MTSDPDHAEAPAMMEVPDRDILLALAEGIEVLVQTLGADAVQRAFAAGANQQAPGPIDPGGLAGADPNRGNVARKATELALQLLLPAIGGEAARYLIGSVTRLGDGSTRLESDAGPAPSILVEGRTKSVRGDPIRRISRTTKVVTAARVLRERSRSADADIQAKAMSQLTLLARGTKRNAERQKPPRGYVEIELLILEASGVIREPKAWEREKAALDINARYLAEVSARALLNALTPQDVSRLRSEHGLLEAVEAHSRNADPADVRTLLAQVRGLHP